MGLGVQRTLVTQFGRKWNKIFSHEMKKSEGAPAVMQYLSFLQGVCQERDLDPSPENYSREVMGESVIIIDFCNQRESPSQVTRTPDTGENLIEEGGERDDTG